MLCPCCSGSNYSECCKPLHLGEQQASTAEALMRSRYAAYAIPNGSYLLETTHPTQRFLHDEQEMHEWGKNNVWTALEIVNKPAINKVEFKAFYTDSTGIRHVHHELSTFKKLNHRWYYYWGRHL